MPIFMIVPWKKSASYPSPDHWWFFAWPYVRGALLTPGGKHANIKILKTAFMVNQNQRPRDVSNQEETTSLRATFGNRLCVQTGVILDNPVRTALDLLVNAPDVFAENAKTDQLDAAEKKN
jgi:hypothetical protein